MHGTQMIDMAIVHRLRMSFKVDWEVGQAKTPPPPCGTITSRSLTPFLHLSYFFVETLPFRAGIFIVVAVRARGVDSEHGSTRSIIPSPCPFRSLIPKQAEMVFSRSSNSVARDEYDHDSRIRCSSREDLRRPCSCSQGKYRHEDSRRWKYDCKFGFRSMNRVE